MTRDARSAAHPPGRARLIGVPRMGTPPPGPLVSDRDEARASGAVTDLVGRTGIRSPSSVTRHCAICGARVVKGRLGFLPYVHAEQRSGQPHYARPRHSEVGRAARIPPRADDRGLPPSA